MSAWCASQTRLLAVLEDLPGRHPVALSNTHVTSGRMLGRTLFAVIHRAHHPPRPPMRPTTVRQRHAPQHLPQPRHRQPRPEQPRTRPTPPPPAADRPTTRRTAATPAPPGSRRPGSATYSACRCGTRTLSTDAAPAPAGGSPRADTPPGTRRTTCSARPRRTPSPTPTARPAGTPASGAASVFHRRLHPPAASCPCHSTPPARRCRTRTRCQLRRSSSPTTSRSRRTRRSRSPHGPRAPHREDPRERLPYRRHHTLHSWSVQASAAQRTSRWCRSSCTNSLRSLRKPTGPNTRATHRLACLDRRPSIAPAAALATGRRCLGTALQPRRAGAGPGTRPEDDHGP